MTILNFLKLNSVLEYFGYSVLVVRDCREMPKKVFDFPNELIDKVIEIS